MPKRLSFSSSVKAIGVSAVLQVERKGKETDFLFTTLYSS